MQILKELEEKVEVLEKNCVTKKEAEGEEKEEQ